MNTPLNRRSFLKRTTLVAGTVSATRFFPASNLLAAGSASGKLNCVQIGCGGRGMSHLAATLNDNLVAIVDVDEKRHAAVQQWLQDKGQGDRKPQVFTD